MLTYASQHDVKIKNISILIFIGYNQSPNRSVPRQINDDAVIRAKSLIHRLNKEKQEREIRKQKYQSKQREKNEKLRELEEQRKFEEQERKNKEKEMKRVIIKQRLMKREQEKLSSKNYTTNITKVPLYMKLEKNFHEKYEVPELQKRKEQLK